MKSAIVVIICLTFMANSFAIAEDEPNVQVQVTEEVVKPDGLRCQFDVTNRFNQGLVTFGVGSNVEARGPFELAAQPSPTSPNGWSDTTMADSNRYAVDWSVTEYANALEPGGRVNGFEIRVPNSGLRHCSALHWKAVTRESEVLTGALK